MNRSKINGHLLVSQRQAIIKLIAKKYRDKRPISLLNFDTKILSKSLAEKLKHFHHELISSNQIAYLINRCISENGRVNSDVVEMWDILDIRGYSG